MDEGESILGAIYEEDNLEDGQDVDMLDIEEVQQVEGNSSLQTNVGQSSRDNVNEGNQESQSNMLDVEEGELVEHNGGNDNAGNQGSQSKNRRRRANKKKNNKKKCGPGPTVMDINRFVSDTCKRLRERKSYMVYTAVGCLGISALSDLVKEVEAIQACGGQMTADGRRFRTGGGVLWSIIRTRAPEAYSKIMKQTKEFEKHFRQENNRRVPEQNNRQVPEQFTEASTQRAAATPTDGTSVIIPDGSHSVPQDQDEQSCAEGKRKSVHDRIRVPVSYDDLLGEDPKNDSV